MTVSRVYFDARKRRWTVALKRGDRVEMHRFHDREPAEAFASEFTTTEE